MFYKIYFHAVDELGKLINIFEYLSIHASETLNADVWANTYLLYCLLDYVSKERKQDTFNIQ